MPRPRLPFPTALAALLTLTAGPSSAEPDPVGAALDAVQEAAPAPPLAVPSVRFELGERIPWAAGTRVRIKQVLHGVELERGDLVVAVDPAGRARKVYGEPLRVLPADRAPALSPEQAAHLAGGMAEAALGAPLAWPPRVEARWFVPPSGTPRRVWAVDLGVTGPLRTFRVLIDAEDGRLLDSQATSYSAEAHVYPSNPDAGELETRELLRLTGDQMAGEYAFVWSCTRWSDSGGGGLFGGGECRDKARFAQADEAGDFFFEPDPLSTEDPLAEVQMYYHLDRVAEWFDRVHNFRLLAPIEGIVNFRYNNAFFGDADGDGAGEVAFGQTNSIDYAYDADVIYHEFGHAVFGRIASGTPFVGADEYGQDWAAGSLNEGTADAFSLLLSGDPRMGEYAAGATSFTATAVRDLEEDRHCPHDLYGEVHRDGEVWGALVWNMIEDERLGAELVADLLFGAVSTWGPGLTWEVAGQSLVDTSAELLDAGLIDAEQRDAILAHGEASGVIGCGRVARLDDGREPTVMLINAGLAEDFAKIPAGIQFSLDAPENAERLRFRVKDWASGSAELGWTLYVRRGEHIVHRLREIQAFGVTFAVPDEYDFAIDGEGGEFELELSAESDPPLEPGATYYFSLASRNLGGIGLFEMTPGEITVDGDVWLSEPPPSADDDDDDDTEGDGCSGCGASLGGATGSALALLLLPLGLRRRR